MTVTPDQPSQVRESWHLPWEKSHGATNLKLSSDAEKAVRGLGACRYVRAKLSCV